MKHSSCESYTSLWVIIHSHCLLDDCVKEAVVSKPTALDVHLAKSEMSLAQLDTFVKPSARSAPLLVTEMQSAIMHSGDVLQGSQTIFADRHFKLSDSEDPACHYSYN